MTKATSIIRQSPVQISTVDDMTYVYIYINEKEVQREDVDENGTKSMQYEYDYNEFSFAGDSLSIDDIKAHPENYIDVSKVEKKKQEANPSLEERVSVIEEILLADMGGE